MNYWIFIAGLIGLFTTAIHIFAGQIEPVKPFLNTHLDNVSKATLLACWHIVSVTLLTTSGLLTFAGWFDTAQYSMLAFMIGLLYCLYSLVFIYIGIYFFKAKALMKLLQWVLLLPIGLLAIIGSVEF